MTSETYLDLAFERNSKIIAGNKVVGASGAARIEAGAAAVGILNSSEKRPIRPKLLKLSDATIPHRNRKKTKTKSKDRSGSSVRDRIFDDPAYTDDISHLANPIRRSSINVVHSDLLSVGSAIGGDQINASGSSSLGKRSKLTKEFQKLAQEDIGHIAFSSSEEDLRYQRASVSRSEAMGRGRSLERSNAVIGEPPEKPELKRRPEKRNKQKRNLSLDNKRQQSQQETKENNDMEHDRAPEPPQRLALTRYNLGKQRSDEAAWQRQKSQTDYTPTPQDNEDVFSLHSSAKENVSVVASTSASLSNASTSKIQMGKRFLKGEIGIKSFNYYLLKEGLKSSKKFVEKQKSSFQSSTTNTMATLASSTAAEDTTEMAATRNKLRANSEENIYEEIFFKDTPASEEDDENQNPSNSHKKPAAPHSVAAAEQKIMYADCELCMQQCDKADCEYCFQNELNSAVNQNRTTSQTFNNANAKTTNNTGNRLSSANINNNSASRTAMENQVNSAAILEFQSYNPNNPGVYKIETTPVAITGDYNPILQFQQPSATQQLVQPQPQQQQHKHAHVQHQSTSTTSTATTTPSDHHQHMQHQQQHLQLQQQLHQSVSQQQQNQPQQFYGYKQPSLYAPHTQTGFWSQTSSVSRPRGYAIGGHFQGGVSSMHRMNTKSSSSSDSLQHQHKFNTFNHLDANYFNGSNLASAAGSASANNSYLPPQPLLYAASRRLGGSQILVDNSNGIFESPPQIYKSDSRASILSEYSLSRSSDTYYGSQRFGHNRHYGNSQLQNFENSLMSSYASASQRRYYGSAESCRFGYDCRRCSLDSGPGAGLLTNPRGLNAANQNSAGTAAGGSEKCTFSDHCKYDCRNCDCSSVYFSSDFDEIYSGGGIPRKTAKGTLPSTGGQPPPPALENYDMTTSSERQQALKQNKYAQDFFKHVNDVKRSIYQAEMQRTANVESISPKKTAKKEIRAKEVDREILGITTLPLAKERTTKPTPAPRTSLQQQQPQLANPGQITPQPLQRRLPVKTNEYSVERKEYASLDRLIASNKGAIPKNSNSNNRTSPHASPKLRINTVPAREVKTNEQIASELEATGESGEKRHLKKHSKETSKITSSSLAASFAGHRRKDIPAPPPPSPATYADLQELQQNMQNTMRDDTKQDKERKRKRKQHESGEHDKQQQQQQQHQLQESVTTVTKDENEQEQKATTEASWQQQPTDTRTTTKDTRTMEQQHNKLANKVDSNLTTKGSTDNLNETANNTRTHTAATESKANTINNTTNMNTTSNVAVAKDCLPGELQSKNLQTTNDENFLKKSIEEKPTEEETTLSAPCTTQTQTSNSSLTLVSATSVSSSIVTAMDSQQRDPTETYDDDVFYDARSEDSACTAASSSIASYTQLKHEQEQQQQQLQQQLQQQPSKANKSQHSEHLQQQQIKPQQQGQEAAGGEYLKSLSTHQQDTNDEDQQQLEQKSLESEGKNVTEQQQQQQQQQQQPSPSDCHKTNEALQPEQQMNKNDVKKKNINIKDVNHLQCQDDVVAIKNQAEAQQQQQQLTDNYSNATEIATFACNTSADIVTDLPTSTTTKNETNQNGDAIADPVSALLKVNKQNKAKQQQTNECKNKNESATTNNDVENVITKDNDKTNKNDKRETKRAGKHKRDYLQEEERRENRLRNQQQQQQKHEVEKPTTTVITTSRTPTTTHTTTANKKPRSQRRSPSNANDNTGGGNRDQTQYKLTTSTLSCDTCCQLEWSQQKNSYNNSPQQQQHSPQSLKPPTLHIGMVGQPARAGKRKPSSSSSTSRERANKTKQEIKTKIIYSQEEPESTVTTTATTTTKKLKTTSRETGIPIKTITKINKPKETETEIEIETETATATETKSKTHKKEEEEETRERPREPATCPAPIESTNVAAAKAPEEQHPKELIIKESRDEIQENSMENPDILREIKEISKAIASLQHEAESSDSITVVDEKPQQHAVETQNVDNVEEKLVAITIATTTTTTTNNTSDCDAAATTSAAADTEQEVSTGLMDQQTANEAVDADDAAAATATPTATATAIDSKTNTTNISCNSEFAGVTTHSPLNSSSPIVPTITTLQSSLIQESDNRRPPLQRQDYSLFDSSEAQSDDSHLTRDSVTIESQNDELSSSTLDKIDVSSLPLPALPPKKRRTKLRASPSKHHHSRSRHESPQTNQQLLQQQKKLRDPHGSDENCQLTAEDNKHLSAFQQYVAKRRESLEASSRSFNEKLESRRMHYHMGGGGGGAAGPAGNSSAPAGAGLYMPTYLFGEQYYAGSNRKSMGGPSSKEEIYLNKSGWVQVNTKRANDENRGYRRANYNHQNGDSRNTIRVIQIDNTRRSDIARQALLQHQHSMMDAPKFVSSKVEQLIQRNEARLGNSNARDSALRPGYRIVDPQLASILNERPGFLPVKTLNDNDSPPPITPILSPPPAFQDSSAKMKSFDRRRTIASRPSAQHHVLPPQVILNNSSLHAANGVNNKGMVFSRSFEYDNRRPTPTDAYVETFSRSFDGNLTERVVPAPLPRDRSPNFSTLTGNSPNYLSKKDSGGGSSGSLKSRESSPKYQSPVASISSAQSPQNQKTTAYLNTSVKEAPPSYSVAGHQAQKYSPRSAHHERSFERSKSHNVLGRSRKSQFSRSGSGSAGVMVNNMGVSRFRSFDTAASQRLNSCDSGARSDLSNDELDIEEDDAGSSEFLNTNSYHPSTSPFKTQRQRSLTPDRNESHSSSSSLRKQRSITPESRSLTPEDRRKKGSQISLSGSRQNSSSRSNTLERKHEKVNISRSSSSSSYSGREHDNHGHSAGVIVGGVGVIEERSGGMRGAAVAMNSTANQHRRSLGRSNKQADEHRIRRSRSLQLTERSPNRGHKMVVCVGQTHANSNQPPLYQQANMRNNFPPTIRTTGKSQSILLSNTNGGAASSGARHRQNDIDKSRSFDFDYCNYNATGNNIKSQHSNSSLLGSQNLLNREAALRLDFDKSRSFDEDYREAVVTNNNLNVNAIRYLQASENSERNHVARIRRSSPVEGNGRNTRSPQSSGSSCNNLNVPRSTTSPQNYGTRLCDHEMTYDLMRKSLDRSPIMDFRRGDSAGGGDYDIPMSMLRNRETINSGGNSELNFMNSDSRQYEHISSNSLKQKRSLRRTHSPNESHYALERAHTAGSRDDITPNDSNEYRNDYNDIYRRTRSNNRGSDLFQSETTNSPLNTSTTNTPQTKQSPPSPSPPSAPPPPQQQLRQQHHHEQQKENCSKQLCSYWPQCGACEHLQQPNYEYLKSLPLKRKSTHNIHHVAENEMTTKDMMARSNSTKSVEMFNGKSVIQLNGHVSTVNLNTSAVHPVQQQQQQLQQDVILMAQQTTQPTENVSRLTKSTSQWTLLCKNVLVSPTEMTVKSFNQNISCLETAAAAAPIAKTTPPLIMATKLTQTTATIVTASTTPKSTSSVLVSIPAALSTTSFSSPTKSSLSPCETVSSSSSSSLSILPSTSNATVVALQQQPRIVPHAATSLVFLGDFEMPITRNRNNCKDIYEKTSAVSPKAAAPNNAETNLSIYEAEVHDNSKGVGTSASKTRETQMGKYQMNKFKDKTSNTMMKKIMENDGKDGCSTASNSSSCNESSTTSSCGSGNKPSTSTTTSAYSSIYRKRKNLKIKAGKKQRYRRRPRMSLPNIWLNLDEQEKQTDSVAAQQQR